MAKRKNNSQDKWLKIGLAVVGIIILLALLISPYNNLVAQDETVNQAWADVEVQYERRADLIPNLVATVQGAADFESETQTQIAALRSAAEQAKQEWDSATTVDEQIAATQKIDQVATSFRGLNINVENYPQLNANQNFLGLQDELAGTENRVSLARTRYNEAVANYNRMVRSFPVNLYAGMFGFERRESFSASDGAENVPTVSF